MYNDAPQQLKQVELSAIHSELLDINEKSANMISQIKDSLQKIHPYHEPANVADIQKGEEKQENSLVNSLKLQLRFGRDNAEKLSHIVRHLNSLI